MQLAQQLLKAEMNFTLGEAPSVPISLEVSQKKKKIWGRNTSAKEFESPRLFVASPCFLSFCSCAAKIHLNHLATSLVFKAPQLGY